MREGITTKGSLDLAIQIQERKADDQMDAPTASLKMPEHEERQAAVRFTCSPLQILRSFLHTRKRWREARASSRPQKMGSARGDGTDALNPSESD